MYRRTVIFKREEGFDEPLLIDFMKTAGDFEAKIRIRVAGQKEEVNAKSIIKVVELGLDRGKEVELSAIGEDEIEAVDALAELITH